MTPQEDDVLLVLLVQSGDTAAFEKLLRRQHAPVRKYVRHLAGESSADDILQDVSWQMFRQIRYLRDPNVLRAWASALPPGSHSLGRVLADFVGVRQAVP